MPIHEYFVGYQLKVYIICGLMAAIAHFIWQKYMDKKSGHIPTEYVETHKTDELEVGPLAYIFLPLLPLIFILIQGLAISADVVGVIVSGIIMGLSVVMGSGVASMFAFAPLVPNFAADLGGNATTILLGMQNAASVGRLLSPISAVMIAVAGIANISSFELVKRTSVPVIVTFITSTIAIWIIH